MSTSCLLIKLQQNCEALLSGHAHSQQGTAGTSCCLQVLDDLLSLLGGGSSTAIYNVDSCLAEVEDLLSYCNDILSAGINPDLLELSYQSGILVPGMVS